MHPTGAWTVAAPDGESFVYVSGDADVMARKVIWTNLRHWEETTVPVFYELARTARRFVDIGAFSGVYTLLACRANSSLEAVAVEPNPVAADMLVRNIDANDLHGRVTISRTALSDAPGRTRLSVPGDTTAASLRPSPREVTSVDVEVTTADLLLGDEPVDLVKIDVEGLEPQVLLGMENTIRTHYPTLIAECLTAAALEELWETAAELGYRHIHHLSSNGPVLVTPGVVPQDAYANFLISRHPVLPR
ncbi:FkbM family methyltransferase [Streptomyces sp. NPDC050738]|uniref:FkbM family methyltransferase n=1 Tax=Streptomyces sp. NPDC050738 TaxID=3154744 RepID=UPI00342EBAAC